MNLVRRAADFGSVEAQYLLGDAYEHGEGGVPDPDRARQYFRLCAAGGESMCQRRLGLSLLRAGRDRDTLEAVAWLELSAEHGDAEAKTMVEKELATLAPDQASRAAKLKLQLVKKP
jgi:TPR repeat protein